MLRDRERRWKARVERRLERLGGDDIVKQVLLDPSTDEDSGADGDDAAASGSDSEETGSGTASEDTDSEGDDDSAKE
jgi:hypothetical protein